MMYRNLFQEKRKIVPEISTGHMHKKMILDAKYHVPTIFLSYAVSCVGAYVCISLCEQLRIRIVDMYKDQHRYWVHDFYLAMMAVAVGGIGIWSMHFIGMQAVTYHMPNTGHIVNLNFNIGLSVASLIAVLITSFVGLKIASTDRVFCKTKLEVIELFLDNAKQLSMSELRKITGWKMLILIATQKLHRLVIGGVITGSGVSIMHYIGMAAMTFDGDIVWQPGIVAFSVVIAIVASTAAFWILFRLLSLFPEVEGLRLASMVIMGVAVNGMHYTGMTAATYHLHEKSDLNLEGAEISNRQSFVGVLVAANLLVWLLLFYVFAEVRSYLQQKMKRLRMAQDTLYRLAEGTAQLPVGLSVNTSHSASAISMSTSAIPGQLKWTGMQLRLLEQYLSREHAEREKSLAASAMPCPRVFAFEYWFGAASSPDISSTNNQRNLKIRPCTLESVGSGPTANSNELSNVDLEHGSDAYENMNEAELSETFFHSSTKATPPPLNPSLCTNTLAPTRQSPATTRQSPTHSASIRQCLHSPKTVRHTVRVSAVDESVRDAESTNMDE